LRPIYPESPEAFEESRQHLRDFLIQFWGGPDVHRQRRGAANLRGRHEHLRIGQAERDAWVRHMTEAVGAGDLSALDQGQMISRMAGAATQLINSPPQPPG
ncbi:MAG: globin, partial [Acidimicrobiales bacterium]